MKKITAMFLAVLLALSVLPGLKASADNVFAPVSLNGAALDSEAYIDDGAVYLPIRSVCEALGFGVT